VSRRSALDLIFGLAGGALLLFLIAPVASTLLSTTPVSFWDTLRDPEVLASIRLTFLAAAAAVVFGLLTGVPLAYLCARRAFRGRGLVQALVNLPLVIPHTAAGIALLMVFGRQGFFGRAFAQIGVAFTDTVAGITVAMAFVGLPFLVNACRETFSQLEPEYEQAALADGASPWQAFWHVTLPQARGGVLSGMLMMWARGVSEFGAIVILAYHPKVVPILVYERFEGFGLNAALPVAALLIVVALIVFIMVNVIGGRRRVP
jgi:molybdate/tungstate transport system permease protein